MSSLDSLDCLDSAVWTIDAEMNALRVSTGYRSLLGYSDEADLRDPSLLEAAVHPADLSLFREQMGRLEQGVSGTIEYRIVLCNGDVKWVQQVGIVLSDGERRPARIQGIVQDITECKAKIHRLDSRLAMLEKLLRSVDVALWSLDQPSGNSRSSLRRCRRSAAIRPRGLRMRNPGSISCMKTICRSSSA